MSCCYNIASIGYSRRANGLRTFVRRGQPWRLSCVSPPNGVRPPFPPARAARQAWSLYVDAKVRRLEVVFDGKGAPDQAAIKVPTIDTIVQTWPHRHVTVRGLTVYRTVGVGISTGPEGVVEDNLVDWAGSF